MPAERLLPRGERALEADGDAHDRDSDRREVRRDQPWPAPGQEAADRNEHEIGQVDDDNEIGEQPNEHRVAR